MQLIKYIFLLFVLFQVILCQNGTQDHVSTELDLNPLLISDNILTLLTLTLVGHMYKKNVGLKSSCKSGENLFKLNFASSANDV